MKPVLARETILATGGGGYRWADVVPGFDMPVRVILSKGATRLLIAFPVVQVRQGGDADQLAQLQYTIPVVLKDIYIVVRCC